MVFKFSEDVPNWCSATMVSDQMALTAAHCVTKFEKHDLNRTVKLFDGELYRV